MHNLCETYSGTIRISAYQLYIGVIPFGRSSTIRTVQKIITLFHHSFRCSFFHDTENFRNNSSRTGDCYTRTWTDTVFKDIFGVIACRIFHCAVAGINSIYVYYRFQRSGFAYLPVNTFNCTLKDICKVWVLVCDGI